MNMPVAEDGSVHFSTTLLALIRESLYIRMGPGLCFVQSLSDTRVKPIFLCGLNLRLTTQRVARSCVHVFRTLMLC